MTPSWRLGGWILQLNEQIVLFIANAQKPQLLCLHFESVFADTSSFTNSRGSTFISVIGVKHLPRKEGWGNHFPPQNVRCARLGSKLQGVEAILESRNEIEIPSSFHVHRS
ncbi:uncharacterized protein CEXT_272491 [Caerostris extrusa]|uniref:Uncharacterized protein n=1 Tax=Caerostris extrusa TaxID=172846 RepID=A0AAV4SU07_CAEEX|nr:uncharacterized protein CEXT_272491 [Caerostris extrusa]